MYEITAIKLSSTPARLDVISEYFFEGRQGEQNQWVSKAVAVPFVRDNPNNVYVSGDGASAWVEAVEANPPYLRTQADGTISDNLLSLPVF